MYSHKLNLMRKKKAAIELSVGTIVVIVLAMSMLILGLVLIRNIFKGSIDNFDALNRNVEGEINKLFNERGEKTVIYLPKEELELKKGKSFGVGFGVKNTVGGESTQGKFEYKIEASSVQKGCQLTITEANNYLILGDSGSFSLSPGATNSKLKVTVQIPDSAPLCQIRYELRVTKEGQTYDTNAFNLKITA